MFVEIASLKSNTTIRAQSSVGHFGLGLRCCHNYCSSEISKSGGLVRSSCLNRSQIEKRGR